MAGGFGLSEPMVLFKSGYARMGLNLYVYQLVALNTNGEKVGDFLFTPLIILTIKLEWGLCFRKGHTVCFIKIQIEPQVLEAKPLVFLQEWGSN